MAVTVREGEEPSLEKDAEGKGRSPVTATAAAAGDPLSSLEKSGEGDKPSLAFGDSERDGRGAPSRKALRNAVVYAVVLVVWVLLDAVTKKAVNAYEIGQVIAGPFLGLFRLKLVHNTGMAWGMLSDSTFFLGVTSVAVCLVLTGYLFATARRASLAQTLGISLVVAGGIGNAIDRFAQGYVVDFIDLVFMDFPVFNIADIGVTCGFVLFLAALLFAGNRENVQEREGKGMQEREG